jgi:hypothetical protein
MTGRTRFMVVAGGAGEYHHDFSVVWVEAQTPEEAAEIVTRPENGYGDADGDRIYVCRTECVAAFETRVETVAKPTQVWVDRGMARHA